MTIKLEDHNVNVILDKVKVITQLTKPEMWDGEGLERSERWICTTIFNFCIGVSLIQCSIVKPREGDICTLWVVTEAIPRRTKSREEVKICKTKCTQNTDHLVKDWKKAQQSRWLLWLIYIKINASKKIYISLPTHTTLPVHKDAIWIEMGREGKDYNFSIYFTGHLNMFYNVVNIIS